MARMKSLLATYTDNSSVIKEIHRYHSLEDILYHYGSVVNSKKRMEMKCVRKLLILLSVLFCFCIRNAYAETYLESIYENYYKILDEEKKPQGDKYITRGEFVALLVGQTDDELLCTFYDVYEAEWDYKYIAVAQNKGYALGDGENSFNSKGYLKVQDAVVFLSRVHNIDEKSFGSYDADEVFDVSSYAKNYVGYAVNENIYPKTDGGYLKGDDRISVKDALCLMNAYNELSQNGQSSVRFLNGYPKTDVSGSSKTINVTLKTDQPCVVYYEMVENEGNDFNYEISRDRVGTLLTSISVRNKEISVNLKAEPQKVYDIFLVLEGMDGKKSGVYSLRNISVLPFTIGNGTVKNPYQIHSAYQFEQIRRYPDKCFLLCIDIDYNKDWIPIGLMRNEKNFSGVFDGGGHYIRGLKIDVETDAGLFGQIDGATIKNLYVDAVVSGKKNTGIIAGISNKGKIINCHTSGSVVAKENIAGGIVGKNDGEIVECVSAVYSVESNSYAGGIAGTNFGGIENCISAVNIVNSGMYASSVAGINSGGIIINTVAASMEVNNDILIKTGRITTNKEGGKTINNYAYSDMLSGDDINIGENTQDGNEVSWEELKSKSFYENWLGWNFENVWTMKNSPSFILPTLKNIHKPELIAGITKYAPKKISNEEDLVNISRSLNSHYYLANDINLEYKNLKEKYWVPLGISDEYGNLHKSFSGTLDGCGHTIRNLKLSHINNVMQYGLFGVIYGGEVRNLKLENVSGNVRGTVGAIAGVNYGKIENCDANGKLDVYDRNGETVIGGICGINYTNIISTDSKISINADTESASIGGISGMNEGFIFDCSHDAKLNTVQGGKSSNVVVGGISGSNYSGYIYNCYANNDINSDSNTGYCGGIAGLMNSGEIYKCSSDGKIYFKSKRKNNSNAYLGGICGLISGGLVMNSFSDGDIEAISNEGYIGGISGFCENASIQNVYTTGNLKQNGNNEPLNSVYSGGIIGYCQDSYVLGSVSINKQISTNGKYGEICGYAMGGGIDSDFSCDEIELSGERGQESISGIRKTYSELKDKNFFFAPVYEGGLLGWDCVDYGGEVWKNSNNKSYPFPILNDVKNQNKFEYILN